MGLADVDRQDTRLQGFSPATNDRREMLDRGGGRKERQGGRWCEKKEGQMSLRGMKCGSTVGIPAISNPLTCKSCERKEGEAPKCAARLSLCGFRVVLRSEISTDVTFL